MECNPGHALAPTFKDEQFTAPVNIRVCSYRVSEVDPDGVSSKAIIDGLVNCGLLQDDSSKYVQAVTFSQVVVKNRDEEKTVVTIEEV